MKLSRRGKHTKRARRGRHTKRAGKHLGYKSKSKKVRGSKRYHRGNKRTYKRGRRLHGGGTEYISGVKFYVKKNGPFMEKEQTFNITIELSGNIATVTLLREDNINITFTITGNYADVRLLLYTPCRPKILNEINVDLKKLKDNGSNNTYDFCSDGVKNKFSFEKIIDKLQRLIANNTILTVDAT